MNRYGLHYRDILWEIILLLEVLNWIWLQINKFQVFSVVGANIQGSTKVVVV